MTWFKIDDGFYDHPKFLDLPNGAVGLWAKAGAWCGKHLTDGLIPATKVKALKGTSAQVRDLIDAGLWVQTESDMGAKAYRFHDWNDFQPTREQKHKERADSAERQRKSRERKALEQGQQENVTRDSHVTGPSDTRVSHEQVSQRPGPTRPDPTRPLVDTSSAVADSPPAKAGGRERKPEPHREDVEALCARLREHIAANTDKPPNITQSWRRDARLLLDKDDIEFDAAMRVLDWCQQDSFWRSNILSMPTFRKQFMRLQIQQRQAVGAGGPSGSTPRYWNSGIEDSPQQDYIDAEVVGIDYNGFGELA